MAVTVQSPAQAALVMDLGDKVARDLALYIEPIRSVAAEHHVSEEEVAHAFSSAWKSLRPGARVFDYLPLFALKQAISEIRHRGSRQDSAGPRAPRAEGAA